MIDNPYRMVMKENSTQFISLKLALNYRELLERGLENLFLALHIGVQIKFVNPVNK